MWSACRYPLLVVFASRGGCSRVACAGADTAHPTRLTSSLGIRLGYDIDPWLGMGVGLSTRQSTSPRESFFTPMGCWNMPRRAPVTTLPVADRAELERWRGSPPVERRLAQRPQIVLLAADGVSAREIADRVGVSRPTVNMWRSRYA